MRIDNDIRHTGALLAEEKDRTLQSYRLSGSMTSEWNFHARHYARMGSPMRPTPLDVEKISRLIQGHDQNVLMLGVTPDYAGVGTRLTAVDRTPQMINQHWPQDSERCTALYGDWLDLPFDDGAYSSVIGDGSINSAASGLTGLFREMRRVLKGSGVAAIRVFCSPEKPQSLAEVAYGYLEQPDLNSTALRFRIAMAIAHQFPGYTVRLEKVLEHFNEMFPDRGLLAEKTGWEQTDIARFDSLKGSDFEVGFPTREHILTHAKRSFASAYFVESEGYPLAELCPVLVLR
ncbi:class I SAM-dependent methyltransferase [Hyphococcus sp.]|uniref:class I SAM-dependent methyltransferase n=2 Tax=Hyphococcus sp. TaxID=2038636 RepID=UPI0035C725ED